MILLRLVAKIIFFPFYFVILCCACTSYLISLAQNEDVEFEEILTYLDIDNYWNLK